MHFDNLSLVQILAILSASAAGGLRIGLPLLIIGLIRIDQLWDNIPFLSSFPPQVIIGVLSSWSLFELLGSKKLIGLRIIQIIQLIFSPFVGGIMAVGVARLLEVQITPLWLLGLIGGLFALVLKLVQVGWFFRLGKIPIMFIFIEDFLSAILVVFALDAPKNGGLIAMLLLWIAIRSSTEWKYRKETISKK
ncbi:DUF4126 domain-containing protein [Cyanobacterium sp. Dongsha4]|uniref:DUF4126 domain-containing protein n=1 Tax=Cyanobacterium sp. DS4 TaxID=2878255 RepID=UPI002E80DAC7|nr:DUF4126 domain-containing protein [Cyanobacterium sp. Dongsha4]WVL00633.1 DUF4126 domain-containing protein [Cyanobacterium sp. Dongsha4]